MSRPALHLPDLPEVPVQLGPDVLPADAEQAPAQAGRTPQRWTQRLLQTLSSYLPLLLMALLASGTWWLVRNTPQAPGPRASAPPSQSPDYTMTGFAITRFAPDGQVSLRIAGDVMRHYPATVRLEIDGVRIQATAPDGRSTVATARRALANGDGSEIQLLGGAQVTSQLAGSDTLDVQGEFLHAFLRFERLRSHLPVRVRHGATDARAGGLDYDNLQQQLRLLGPVRATVQPAGRARSIATPTAAPTGATAAAPKP